MGTLVQTATETLTRVVRYCAGNVLLAEIVEDLLGDDLLKKVGEGAMGFYLFADYDRPNLKIHIYAETLKEDRAFLHQLRRALRVSSMERQFRDLNGSFEWRGKSEVAFRKRPIEVTITAGNSGCVIRRIEETVTRMRYESTCKPEDSVLSDYEEAVIAGDKI